MRPCNAALFVTQMMDEFSKPRYGVDILKVQLPVNPAFVEGTAAFAGGEAAYSRQEALELFRLAGCHSDGGKDNIEVVEQQS